MAQLVLTFLGTFQVLLDQHPVTHFRSSANQGLLVYLALNKEKALSRELLSTLLWPEETEKTARHNLRQALYRLRGLLQDRRKSGQPFLLTTRHTVQFNPEGDTEIDVEKFLEAIDAHDLDKAAARYGGDLLPGFAFSSELFEDWLRVEREYLHQLALEGLSAAAQEHLQDGRLDQAQELARRQLKLEPWREPAHRQLMQAYALAGDRASALAQFERCRQHLWEHIGVDPAPETVRIREEIAAGRLGRITAETAIHSPSKIRHNLPTETTPFIGREGDVVAVLRRLTAENQRLVTIVAPGGMGKTRLALAAAAVLREHFQDGVYFVDLAPVTDAEEVAPAVAAALSYQAPDNTAALLPQLLNTLSRQNLLLVLDNFEQVADGGSVVSQILRRCPHISLLVTSRQPLNLASENRYRLEGLEFPDLLTVDDALSYTAVQLFVDSGRRVRSGFELTAANMVYVLHICRLVQGMPLALILASAWLELLTTAEIAREIEQGLHFLTADLTDLPARQRSMHAVFDRSWQRLQLEEQRVMAKLSVFRGGFSRKGAEKVANANLRILLSLANKSFLQRQPDSDRFVIHELLRQYAAEQRERFGEEESARLKHCRYFAQLVQDETERSLFYLPLLLPHRCAADRDNIQQAWDYALQHGYAHELADLANGMIIFATSQGIQPAKIISAALVSLRQQDVPEMDEAMLKLRAAELRARQMVEAHSEVRPHVKALIDLLEPTTHYELRYWLRVQYAMMWRLIGDPSLINILFEALSIAKARGDKTLADVAVAMRLWGHLEAGQREERTLVQLKTLLPRFEAGYPDSFILYGILRGLSFANAEDAQYEEAIRYGARALNIAKRWGDLYWINITYERLAQIKLRQGLPKQAGSYLLESMEWHVALGQEWQMLGFLVGPALLDTQLIGGGEVAAMILSMINHHAELTDFVRYKMRNHLSRLQDNLEDAAFGKAWQTGMHLDIDDIISKLRIAWL